MTTKLLEQLRVTKALALTLASNLKKFSEENECLHVPVNTTMTFNGYISYIHTMAEITAQMEDIVQNDALSLSDMLLMEAALTEQVDNYNFALEILRIYYENNVVV